MLERLPFEMRRYTDGVMLQRIAPFFIKTKNTGTTLGRPQ